MAKIRHKNTGQVFDTDKYNDFAFVITVSDSRMEFAYDSIAELMREWEDYGPEVINGELEDGEE